MIGAFLGCLSQLLQLEAHSRFSATGALNSSHFFVGMSSSITDESIEASWTKSSDIGRSLGSRRRRGLSRWCRLGFAHQEQDWPHSNKDASNGGERGDLSHDRSARGPPCGIGGPNEQISGPSKYSCQMACEPKSRNPPKPIDTIPSTKYTFFKSTKMG